VVEQTAQKRLNEAFSALSDPTRRAIIDRLAGGPARVTDVAEPFAMSLNAVSKHVKVLERAGLIHRVKSGREHTLQLSAEPLRAVVSWASRFERFWNERLDNLEALLASRKERKP